MTGAVESRRPIRQLTSAILSIDSYGAVLLSIIVTYAAAILITDDRARTLVLVLQIGTVWLVFRVAQSRPAARAATNVMLVMAAILAALNLAGLTGEDPGDFLFAASCVLYLVAPVVIVHHLALRPEVDLETLLGAIASYLLIGMFFAFSYRWLGEVQAAPFFGTAGEGSLADDLFFSFTTMTTIGFGNLVPEGNPGQTLAVAEGLIGQLFLVVAVTKVVSSWKPKQRDSATAGDG